MRNGAERKQQDSGRAIMLIFFIGLLFSGATLRAASSVTVQIDSAYPDPACIGDTVDAMATAVFDAEGREQEQASLGWVPEYRWKWEMLSDGEVTTATPALDPENPPWTLWSDTNQSTMDGDFPSAGEKIVRITVEVRLHKTGVPTSDSFTDTASEALTVINLENVPRVFLISRNIGEITLGWAPSPSPNIAGYKYHIAPDSDTLYDVGNVTHVRITGLTPGEQVTIYVHTYNTDGHMTRSPSWTGIVPIDTDGDGEFDDVEDLIGTEKNDFGSQPGPITFTVVMTTQSASTPEWPHTTTVWLDDNYWGGDYWHVGDKKPSIPAGFVYPWSDCPEGGGEAEHELYDTHYEMLGNMVLEMTRPGLGTLPEEMIDVLFYIPSIEGLNCYSAEPQFFFPYGEVVGTSSRPNTPIAYPEEVFRKIIFTGFDWITSVEMGPPGPGATGPVSEAWSDALCIFPLAPLQADLDYTTDVPNSGRPDFQEAPLQMISTAGRVDVFLGGRTPVDVVQTITLSSSNTDVLRFTAGSVSSGGQVSADGSQAQWVIKWTSYPKDLSVCIEEGDNPGGQSATLTGNVADITGANPDDEASSINALKVRLFPAGTKEFWSGNEVPAFFVAQTGSQETTTLLNVDLDIDSDNDGALDNSTAEDRLEDTIGAPGKLILPNDGDADGDGIPNHSDYDGDDGNAPQFAPISLQFCSEINPAVAKVKFSYPDITPGTTPSSSGPEIRIWTKNGNVSRNLGDLKTGGDFVGSGNTYSLADLPLDPDASDTLTRRLLFVEGVTPSAAVADSSIEVLVDPDGPATTFGFDLTDAVPSAVTTVKLQSVEFISDHEDAGGNNLLKRSPDGKFANIGTAYEEPEWLPDSADADTDPDRSNPISHTKQSTVTVKVKLKVEPAGLAYNLIGDGPNDYLDFESLGRTSTGTVETITMTPGGGVPTPDQMLPNIIKRLEKNIIWTVHATTPAVDISAGISGPHEIFLTFETPIQNNSFASANILTWKRLSEVIDSAGLTNDINTIATNLQIWRDNVGIDNTGRTTGTDGQKIWALLDRTEKGQCGEGSLLMEQAVRLLGIQAEYQHVLACDALPVPVHSASSPASNPTRHHCGVTEHLWLYFSLGSGNPFNGWNQGEGCCLVGGKLYSAWAGGIIGETGVTVGAKTAQSPAHHILLQLEASSLSDLGFAS